MKKEFYLEFCFKGNRTYVQGPDIFDASLTCITANFNIIEKVKYTAYHMLHKNASLIITDNFKKSDYPIINSLITFIKNKIKYFAVIVENQQDIECSVEYSENIVQQKSILETDTISFLNTLDDSYTEVVVSMNKYFLTQTLEATGKWIVTKFDYDYIENITDVKNKMITIKLLQNLNNTLTKSSLYIEDNQVGHIYFSLIPKES